MAASDSSIVVSRKNDASKYMRHNAMENNIWDKEQLGLVEGI